MECKTSSGSYLDTNTTENQESKVPQESGGDLHTEYYIYREDVVKSNNDESMLGVVIEVPGDSDSDSSSSYDSDVFYGGNSAIDSNDSTPTNKSNEKNDCLAAGQAKIMWIDGNETTSGLDDISLINRGFLHGDIISSVTDPTGQLGLVLDVHITVDLLSPTGELVTNVSSRDLKRFREFTVGDYVVCGSWLGRVDDMVENVIVLFDDGSVCKVMKADTSRLKPISKSIASDGVFPYYPGQRVRAASSSVFKGSRWLSGLWKANRLEGTVTKVQAGTLFVYWIASSNPGEGSARGMVPSEEQNPKDLTLLSCFSHVNWQLGEWCLFYGATTAKEIGNSTNRCKSDNNRLNKDIGCESENVKEVQSSLESHRNENDHILNSSPTESIDGIVNNDRCRASDNAYETSDIDETSKLECSNAAPEPQSCSGTSSCLKDSSREGFPAYRKKIRKVFFKREKKGHKRDEEHAKAFIIANITTKVDVVWQDGTRKFQMDSKLLVPFNNPGDQDFFPEQYIIEKALNENENTLNENECCAVKRVGVVKSVDAKERIACVRWLKHVSKPEDIREFDKKEMVSVYELDMHPDYDYCYGDVVVRLSPASIPPSSATSETHIQEQDDHMTLDRQTNTVQHHNWKNTFNHRLWALDDIPPGKKFRDRRRERNGDRNSNRKQSLVQKNRNSKRASTRSRHLSSPITLLLLRRRPTTTLNVIVQDNDCGRVGSVDVRFLLLLFLLAGGGETDPLKEGFDVYVVLDGDVKTGYGRGGDREVDSESHLAVLVHQFPESPRRHCGRKSKLAVAVGNKGLC